MTTQDAAPTRHDGLVEPRWGLGDAIGGWLLAYAAALVWGVVLFAATGTTSSKDLSLAMLAIGNVPLWAGFIGTAVWAGNTKGNGWVQDFRVHLRAWDVPLGIAAGVAAQFILVPLVSMPVLWLSGQTAKDLEAPAREMADKATGAGGVVLLVLIVGVMAPFAEELFFRGLVLRSMERRWAPWIALVASSAVFGATHFEPLQFAGLTAAGLVFGLLAQRTGRVGPAMVAHLAFNLSSIAVLLAAS
ncbi:MAG: type II CAAX endopeptidase family protein [Acidimicrobiales bacterium]